VRQTALLASALVALTALVAPSVTPVASAAGTPTLLAGFPQTVVGEVTYSSPAVVDFNRDGRQEVLVGDQGGCVWAISAQGQVLPGFPWTTIGDCRQSARIAGPLAIADLDGDGKLDVAAGSRATSKDAGKRGKTWVWRNDGKLMSGWPKEMPWHPDGNDLPEVYSVVLADVTGDKALEVIAGTNNNSLDLSVSSVPNLFAWTANGTLLNGYPTGYRTAGIYGGIAAADLTGDGKLEPLVGRDHVYVHAYNAQGQWLPGWPARTYVDPSKTNYDRDRYIEFTDSVPSAGDLDGDGKVEVVIAGKVRDPLQSHQTVGSALLVIGPDGARRPGWTIPKLGGVWLHNEFRPNMAPALGDLDGDGKLEIVVALFDGTVRAYRHDGTELWKYDYAQGAVLAGGEPALGDVTGDGKIDVVFGTYSPNNSAKTREGIVGLDRSGKLLPGFPLRLSAESGTKTGIRAGLTLADLNGDGTTEIVAASRGGALYAWNTGAPFRTELAPWPTGRHDLQRTGFASTRQNNPLACAPQEQPPQNSPVSPVVPPQLYLPLVKGCGG
jgi:hypothetical protein